MFYLVHWMVLHVQLQDMQDIYIPIPCITLFSYLGFQYYSPTGTVTSLSPRVSIVHISTPEHLKTWRVQEWNKYLHRSKHINNRVALSLSFQNNPVYNPLFELYDLWFQCDFSSPARCVLDAQSCTLSTLYFKLVASWSPWKQQNIL